MASSKTKTAATSTVGRSKAVNLDSLPKRNSWQNKSCKLNFGDSLKLYKRWPSPVTIVSDGAYGVLGFEGDTSDHLGIANWYEPHIKAWSEKATGLTTLWFWNSEIGWAAAHPVLEKYGFRYVNSNSWNKGKAHIAGNVNTAKIRRFPVVTEVCVQYVYEQRIDGLILKQWLHREWKRTGMPFRKANDACGVKDAAVRKYLDQGHLWYFPPPEMFAAMASYANEHGDKEGRPYFSQDGKNVMTADDWLQLRSKFNCPMGFTNVWDRKPLKGTERIRVPSQSNRAAHLNQKPLDLLEMIIESSTDRGDVIWEPFGGLFSASIAAARLGRKSYSAEIDPTYYQIGRERAKREAIPNQFDV